MVSGDVGQLGRRTETRGRGSNTSPNRERCLFYAAASSHEAFEKSARRCLIRTRVKAQYGLQWQSILLRIFVGQLKLVYALIL